MRELEPLLAHWRAQDALFERVDATPWGAVVSDARYPAIQEPNYARVDTHAPTELAEIEAELLPAMARSGSIRSHVVIFFPEDQTDLLAEASTRGERLTWDLVMIHEGEPPTPDDRAREVEHFDEDFWKAHAASTRLFDIDEQPTVDQLQTLERDVLIPGGRRWFIVPGEDGPVAFAALLVLEGSGFLDHVVTLPQARRRGHADALTRRALGEAAAVSAERTYLLAEPDGAAERIYARLGFERAGHLASWLSPNMP